MHNLSDRMYVGENPGDAVEVDTNMIYLGVWYMHAVAIFRTDLECPIISIIHLRTASRLASRASERAHDCGNFGSKFPMSVSTLHVIIAQ